MKFVNLYVQTEYNMLSSAISLSNLFDFCANRGIKSVGMADFGMYGSYKFYRGCQDRGMKPILGLRCNLLDLNSSALLVYARNHEGYQSLMRLATRQAQQGGCILEEIAKEAKGLIIILPSDEHEAVRLIRDQRLEEGFAILRYYRELFSNFYIGLNQQSEVMCERLPMIVSLLKANAFLMVALHQTTYLMKEDLPVYQTLRSIEGGSQVGLREIPMHYLTPEEEASWIESFPELVHNTEVISSSCQVTIQTGTYLFPSYGMDNSREYLETLCKVGLNKRLQNRNVDVGRYRDRLLYELSIIDKMGYNDYFLIVYDYVKYAKQNGIFVGTGRGSAPGSLVIYCLGITEVDPLEYDLLFERFLNPDRISMPDIDVDFPDDRREEIIAYVASRFGQDRVAYISTFGTFGARMAIRDVARVMQITDQRLQMILKPVQDDDRPLNVLIQENELIQRMMEGDEDIHKLYTLAAKMEGLPRHTSTHAAGIIMADGELVAYTALQKGLGGLWQTQYEAGDLEAIGLVKMDILGLRNLTIIKNVLDLIAKYTKQNLNIYQLPLQDAAVYKMIASKDTAGIFQLESRGMRQLLMNLKTSSFMDIVNANALFRPGPMEMIPVFIKRKFGEKVVYPHPDLKPILEATYGTIVYQEQIILIAQRFAGYTLGMADLLRRAVSKKNHQVLEAERTRFVSSAVKQGYSETLSHEIYDYIVKFANYGFNKSHSVAYAMIAYQMAYLKVHYYLYFMAVLMSNSIGSPSAMQSYIAECRRNHVEVMLPSINKSSTIFEIGPEGLYYPFVGIANLGNAIASELVKEREAGLYQNYDDFVRRTASFLNKRHVANLVYAGALDEFQLTRKYMIESYEESLLRKDYAETLGSRIITHTAHQEEYTFDEISILEKETLGFNLKYNLLIKYQQLKIDKKTTNLDALVVGKQVRVLFIIRSIRNIKTKNNEPMAFLDIYDDSGSCEAVVFARTYRQISTELKAGFVYIGVGQVTERNDRLQVVFENVYSIK
ncbi:MAG: DNA polymerase III subunit alpha [Bacilli bacterium]|nr:DNA polymerase III subunit alpha [Bacilli bacterium]